MPITNLVYSDTFKTWFDTTNSIINSVNGITVYNILAGDGIGITSANNIFTISHGSSVATGVTFTGNVKFDGSVSFASSPSISSTTVNVTPKITGITSGNVVRMTSSGLTLAKADSATNAEVLGIVVSEDSSSYNVAINGAINNTFFANTISNALGIAGGTLNPGQAYFLDPYTAGGITVNEPQTYGYVTKPILLGITGNVGSLIPYRGIQLEGISAGITAELDNKIVIQLSNGGGLGTAVKIGDPVIYFKDTQEYFETLGIDSEMKVYGNLNNSTYAICAVPDLQRFASPNYLTQKEFLGLVSKILVNDGVNYVLEITLPGGSFNVNTTDLDSNFYTDTTTTQQLDLNTSSKLISASGTSKFCDFIITGSGTAKIILASKGNGSGTGEFIGTGAVVISGSTAALEYDNLIPNGSFSIWQRQNTGLTLNTLNEYSTPFADRWFVIKYGGAAAATTSDFNRVSFDSNQVQVPGSPLYYVTAKTQYSASPLVLEHRTRLENIQVNARLLQNQQATLSFWAKSTVSGSTLDIVYNRYTDTYLNAAAVENTLDTRVRVTTPSGITLTTSWSQYNYTFTPTVAGFTLGATASGWFAVGFEFPSSTATISLAQVQLELGSYASDLVYVSPETELERCKPYYLRTYDWDQNNGFIGTSRLNEQILQLGNLVTQKNYVVKFPVKMIKTPSYVTLFSPVTGQTGDAYNVNTGVDMRYSGSDYKTNLPWDMNTSRTSSAWPTANITVPSVSSNGMTVNISNGATHLDTLQFHYVADADLNINL